MLKLYLVEVNIIKYIQYNSIEWKSSFLHHASYFE